MSAAFRMTIFVKIKSALIKNLELAATSTIHIRVLVLIHLCICHCDHLQQNCFADIMVCMKYT